MRTNFNIQIGGGASNDINIVTYNMPGASSVQVTVTSSLGDHAPLNMYLGRGNPPDFALEPPVRIDQAANGIYSVQANFDAIRFVLSPLTPQSNYLLNIQTANPEDVGPTPVVSGQQRQAAAAAQLQAQQAAAAQQQEQQSIVDQLASIFGGSSS